MRSGCFRSRSNTSSLPDLFPVSISEKAASIQSGQRQLITHLEQRDRGKFAPDPLKALASNFSRPDNKIGRVAIGRSLEGLFLSFLAWQGRDFSLLVAEGWRVCFGCF